MNLTRSKHARARRLREKRKLYPVKPKGWSRVKRNRWRSPEYVAYIGDLPCCVTGVTKDVDPHHIRQRSLGGQWHHLVPLAHWLHEEWHKQTGTDAEINELFKATYGVDLEAVAAECARNFPGEKPTVSDLLDHPLEVL